MDIQELKNACNEKYAQAIEGMERGDANAEIARLLLDAAELLVKISKADFLTRAASENKAAKLLAAAKKLRATGDTSAVYRDLTGRTLNVVPKTAPQAPNVQRQEDISDHTQQGQEEERNDVPLEKAEVRAVEQTPEEPYEEELEEQ